MSNAQTAAKCPLGPLTFACTQMYIHVPPVNPACCLFSVWQRLEDENQDFFKAYYLKLLVKEQIMEFNRLLSEQVDLMRRTGLNGIAPYLPSNGSHVSPCKTPFSRNTLFRASTSTFVYL